MKHNGPRLVPADAELGGLQNLFWDSGAPEFVVAAVRQRLGLSDISSGGSVIHVHYRPHLSCKVAWTFQTSLHRSAVVTGTLFVGGEGERIVASAAFQARAALLKDMLGPDQEPYAYLPKHGLLLELAPLDAGLPGLLSACSPPFIREMGRIAGGAGVSKDAEARIVAYKPGQRCVLEYGWDTDRGSRRVIGKILADRLSGETVLWLQNAAAQLRERGLGWLIVPPLMHIREAGVVVFEVIEDGEPPTRMLRRARHEPRRKAALFEQLHRAASGLTALQGLDGAGLPEVTANDALRALTGEVESIRLVAPTLADALDERVELLSAVMTELEPERAVPCHGAYRFSQMLAVGSDLHVLDFDSVCLAGPSSDAANLLAYLDKMVLRRPKLAALIGECQVVFRDAALEGLDASEGWMAWYRAASHLKIAVRSFHALSPRWPSITRRMLELSEEQLKDATTTRAMA